VATVRPFKGFRPLPEYAPRVAAKPYDVLNSDEARTEAAGNPISFLHVGKPEIDLPTDVSPYDKRVYQRGKENLQKLITDGILKEDDTPCFYLYAQALGDHVQYGIVGCVSVDEYLNDTIRKHELTTRDKEDDRTKHVMATNAHTGPILLMYRNRQGLASIVDHVHALPPTNNFVADDGVRHLLWVIRDKGTIGSIAQTFRNIDRLYVADGHHRSAAAARVAQERTHSNPRHTGNEEYNHFLAVLFPHNQLRIMDYNRVVKDLNGQNTETFLGEIRRNFEVQEHPVQERPSRKGEYRMYLNRHWYTLTSNARLLASADPVGRLDVSILQNHLLGPVLGINDPRKDKRIDFVGGIRGLDELEKRVNTGEMAVAFALYPTSVDELIAIADAGKIMPPKSTWFEPKLRDGLVVHMLD